MPSIIGASSSPASVGLTSATACRYSGTNTTTENSDAVARNSAPLATATERVPSSCSGSIGSAARRSRATSATASASAAAPRPRISAESQA